MSPQFKCNTCDFFHIGDSKFGCQVCIKKELSHKILSIHYAKSLIGIQLPIELVLYISQLAATKERDFYDNYKLDKYHTICWKSRMHCLIK